MKKDIAQRHIFLKSGVFIVLLAEASAFSEMIV